MGWISMVGTPIRIGLLPVYTAAATYSGEKIEKNHWLS